MEKTRDIVLVSEDLATGKRKRRPVDSRKDQGRHRRIWIRRCACLYQKNQQLLMIAKRGNAPTIPMTVPLEFPSLTDEWKMQSRRIWGVKVTRDHPIYPWVFEWATTQMTRYTHTWEIWERQQFNLLRCSKSSKNIAQFGDKILYKPLKLSGHLRANMEDTFLDGIFLGMTLQSDEFSSEQPEESPRRAHYEDELGRTMGQWFRQSKGNLDKLFLGSTATTFLQQFRTERE